MKDQCFVLKTILFQQVFDEHLRQIRKWGLQDRDPFEWLGFATEELGEVAEAISEHRFREGSASAVVKESIQAATLLIKIAEMYSILELRERKKSMAPAKVSNE